MRSQSNDEASNKGIKEYGIKGIQGRDDTIAKYNTGEIKES